jgi:biotin carboxyl carrier protein
VDTWTLGNLSVNKKVLATQTVRTSSPGRPTDPAQGGYFSQGSRPGHIAMDWAIAQGSKIFSPLSGTVLRTNVMDSRGYGNLIEVQSLDGSIMYFAHLSKFLVKPGQNIRAGQQIAESGNTWSAPGSSTGPHLHFAVKDPSGQWIKPEDFFSSGSKQTVQQISAPSTSYQASAGTSKTPAYKTARSSSQPALSAPSTSYSAESAAPVASGSSTAAASDGTVLGRLDLLKVETPLGTAEAGLDITMRTVFFVAGGVLVVIGLIRISKKEAKPAK